MKTRQQTRTCTDQCTDSCAICLELMNIPEQIGKMEACDHKFHKDCLIRSLQRNTSCPLCRRTQSPGSETSDSDMADSDDDMSSSGSESLDTTSSDSSVIVDITRNLEAHHPLSWLQAGLRAYGIFNPSFTKYQAASRLAESIFASDEPRP